MSSDYQPTHPRADAEGFVDTTHEPDRELLAMTERLHDLRCRIIDDLASGKGDVTMADIVSSDYVPLSVIDNKALRDAERHNWYVRMLMYYAAGDKKGLGEMLFYQIQRAIEDLVEQRL